MNDSCAAEKLQKFYSRYGSSYITLMTVREFIAFSNQEQCLLSRLIIAKKSCRWNLKTFYTHRDDTPPETVQLFQKFLPDTFIWHQSGILLGMQQIYFASNILATTDPQVAISMLYEIFLWKTSNCKLRGKFFLTMGLRSLFACLIYIYSDIARLRIYEGIMSISYIVLCCFVSLAQRTISMVGCTFITSFRFLIN